MMSRLVIVPLVVFFACAGTSPGWAVDNDPQPPVLNCGDPKWRDICLECCPECDGTEEDRLALACCEYDDEGAKCVIVNEPPTTGLTAGDIAAKVVYSGLKLELKRKEIVRGGALLVKLSLKGQLTTPGVRKRFGMKGTIRGVDASVGSLAYAVGFVGLGEAALGRLQAQGKDIALDLSGAPFTCESSFTAADCQLLALQLSRLIDGALPPNGDERTGFAQSVTSLGFAPCSTRSN